MDSNSKKILVTVAIRKPGLPVRDLQNVELTIPRKAELTTGEAKKQISAMKITDYILVGPILVGPAFKEKDEEEGPVGQKPVDK